jgi:mannose-6-phosphate isomerase-like protein (cupin superfamily)
MADTEYSHVNFLEIDDQAPNLGADPTQFNIHFGRVPLNCEDCGVSYVRYAPGAKAHGHRHKRQEEIYVVVRGSAQMKVGDDVIELKQWDAVRVPPHVMRGIKGGPEGAEVIAVGAPNTGPGDGDAPDPDWTWDD